MPRFLNTELTNTYYFDKKFLFMLALVELYLPIRSLEVFAPE
jgi:hypothetical protein